MVIGDNYGPATENGRDVYGDLESRDYNLIEKLGGWTLSGPTGNNITGVDAKLDALDDNGGATETHALGSGSPAIDAASCTDAAGNDVTVDQRDVPRPRGVTCDMGAFEDTEPWVELTAVPIVQAVGSPVELTATVFDEQGEGDPHTYVQFRALPFGTFSGGGRTIIVPTDDAGQAMATLNADRDGTTNVTATSPGATEDEVSLRFYWSAEIVGVESDSPVVLGQAVQFTATVTGTAPLHYNWDFGGDGEATGEDGPTPQYVYSAAGNYTVTLRLDGPYNDDYAALVVTVYEPVNILDLTSNSPVVLGEAMHFTSTVAGTEPYTYTWDFGGAGSGGGEETATPTYTYAAGGTYTVTLRVDGPYDADEAELVVEVCHPVEITDLASDSPVVLGETMHFTAAVVGSEPYTYTWDFGGAGLGGGEETATPTYTYAAGGTYTVTLRVGNECGEDEAELAVVVCDPVGVVDLISDSPVVLGETMRFTATVTGSEPYTYAWDFGGDGTAGGQAGGSPWYQYAAAGAYTVTLRVENACGADQAELAVEVCGPVEITGVASNSPVVVGETMSFTATVTGSEPYTYTWDFGGAGIPVGEETAVPVYTYASAGTYTVTLRVENACGVDEVELVVEVCGPAEITHLASDSPAVLGDTMSFTATVVGSEPYTYTWDFGGPGTGSGDETGTPTYVYASAGTYTVTLRVENACGVDEAELVVEVCGPAMITDLASDSPVVLGQTMHFTATVVGSEPYTYTWDFGGAGSGGGEETATPTYTYAAGGRYTATLQVENACGEDEAELAVVVCDPVGIADLASDSPVVLGETMHFTATVTGSEPYTYTWDFGGAGTGDGEETAVPTHTYASAGTYTVTLRVENACGEDEAELVVEVCGPAMVVGLASDSPAVLGETIHFTATVTGSEPVTYTWDFGGAGTGGRQETAVPTYTYASAGTYKVTLRVENACGADEAELTVVVCHPVEILALASDSPVVLGETMFFLATVAGSGPYVYEWDFGGAGTGTGDETGTPSYVYASAGTYTVTLRVSNLCSADEAELVVKVCGPVEIVDLTSDSPVALGEAMSFTATVAGTAPITYTWDFGGEGTESGEETGTPTFIYGAAGIYTVTLRVENACGEDEAELAVVVCDPAKITGLASDSPVVLGETMHFTATVSGWQPYTYTWDFGGAGLGGGGEMGTATYSYATAGTYTVTLRVENACGADEAELVVAVCGPVEIVGLASGSPAVLGEAMSFTATVAGTGPITYAWEFGGAGTGSGEGTATPTYTYAAAGKYTVTLSVENACGEDEAELVVEVCGPVQIVDLSSDSPVMVPEAMHFSATVMGTEPYTYTWDFGGEGVAALETTATPMYLYAAVGSYTVTLRVQNACGEDEAELAVEVVSCDPVQIVEIRLDNHVTLGETTQFTATVVGSAPLTYLWDFESDGTPDLEISDLNVAAHTYDAPGAYTATLTAKNCYSCGPYVDALSFSVIVDPVRLFLPQILADYRAFR